MESICPRELCTGCAACYSSCAKKAIEMVTDDYGYLYPQINQNTCVDCEKCVKICPVNHPLPKNPSLTVYAVHDLNEKGRAESASGGFGSIAARHVLKSGGVIYGSVQSYCTKIQHERIEEPEDFFKIRGSKYVQSAINDCFLQCKKDLIQGKRILFTGTPCQIAGLKNYLGKECKHSVMPVLQSPGSKR